MAKAYRQADGQFRFRATVVEERMNPVPGDAAAIVDFDEDTNAALLADIRANLASYAVTVGGLLQKDGATVTPAADGDRAALRRQAAQAVADNNTYLAIGSPTNAQNLAQIRALTRQMNAAIKRLVQLDALMG